MSLGRDAKSDPPKRQLGVVWMVLCVIVGAALAFLAAAFDGIMSFGSSFTRFIVVFLVSWPVGVLLCYLAFKDLQEKWLALRNPSREVRSLTEPRVIVWIVVIVILGLLYLIFGNFSLTP